MTVTQVPDEAPDWTREHKWLLEWNPSKSLLASIRAYQHWRLSRNPLAGLFRRIAVLRHQFWSVVCGAEIPLNCRIGGGLLIPHPNGIVIHPDVVIGTNCLIFQQVTLGSSTRGVPSVGSHVDIGAGARSRKRRVLRRVRDQREQPEHQGHQADHQYKFMGEPARP